MRVEPWGEEGGSGLDVQPLADGSVQFGIVAGKDKVTVTIAAYRLARIVPFLVPVVGRE